MSETVKNRRRWPWLVLFVLALLIGGPLAWRLRPLNSAERALLGEWYGAKASVRGRAVRGTVIFSADRRFLSRSGNGSYLNRGSWRVTASGLLDFTTDSKAPLRWADMPSALLSWFVPTHAEDLHIETIEVNRMSVVRQNGDRYSFDRVQ